MSDGELFEVNRSGWFGVAERKRFLEFAFRESSLIQGC